jgi:hypothetical protein
MSYQPPTTGVGGGIAWLRGATTLAPAEPCSAITTLSGSPTTYPANQCFRITARAHSVLDPRSPTIVKNATVAAKQTDYYINWGTGEIVFYTPLTGTPTITIDCGWISTASGTDVPLLSHVNNWQAGSTAAQIPADEYGKRIVPSFAGKVSGTFQFDYYSSSDIVDLMSAQRMRANYFVFALFEDLVSNRMRIVYANVGGFPVTAPGAGMVGGTCTGGLFEDPTFRAEALV